MNATAEIKRSVDLAVDVLLGNNPFDEKKVSTLRTMGFGNTENVRDYEDHSRNHDHARHYAQRYPGFKFITRHQLDKITEKFNLKEGELSSFKGAIPDKNVNDRMAFEVFESDLDMEQRRSGTSGLADAWMDMYMPIITGRTRDIGFIRGGSFDDSIRGMTERVRQEKDRMRNNRPNSYGPPSFEDAFISMAQKMHQRDEKVSFTTIAQRHPQCLRITAEPALFIAPDPDLDPIVTVAVKGGYLIASAWGAEANDPDVANQRMN